MTEEQFLLKYPKEKYKYIQTRRREKGHMGQTEIYSYDIVDIATDEIVYKATYTEHMNVKGFATTEYWE
ncbi:hypothetical protein [Erwinia sp. JH02]|uniref:hypothetical protein n=1 Tax=Erwinia sp. JH02 TaxID=2733394 RepID=UPI00148796BB|nr:hypothetical protein [Erwinia sp. JH02]NNS08331.1 hypothetical protein [Erwinia sp. JH02]